jgi:hypothetical protein
MRWRANYNGDVGHLEMMVVQLEEVRSLLERDTANHARLALILLDNAAENLMFHAIETALMFNPQSERILRQWDEIVAQTNSPSAIRERDRVYATYIPKGKRRQLEYKFDAKIDFLQERDQIESTTARVLKKLHRHRNQLYHRDIINFVTIQSACLIYFDVVCTLLETLRLFGFRVLIPEIPPVLAKYGAPATDWGPPGTRVITAQLRSGLGIDGESLKQTLVTHLTSRLDELESNLVRVGRTLFNPFLEKAPSPTWRELIVRLAQVHEEREAPPSFEALLKLKLPYGVADIPKWRDAVASLEPMNRQLNLFAAFADIEDEFEPFELQVDGLTERISHEVQMEEDMRRGK